MADRELPPPPPPDYAPADAQTAAPSPNDIIQPGTFLLAERFIHAAESSSSPPLYELAFSIDSLREHNREVSFSRLDYRVKSSAGSAFTGTSVPEIAGRKRLVYTLRHPAEITAPAFPYYMEGGSRQALGNLGLQRLANAGLGLTSRRNYAVWKLALDPRPNHRTDFVAREKIFDIKQAKSNASGETPVFIWTAAASGVALATESEEGGLRRLKLNVSAERMLVDALIGAWCLRLWIDLAEGNHQHRSFGATNRPTWDDVQGFLWGGLFFTKGHAR